MEIMNKSEFVKNELSALLKATSPDIVEAEYYQTIECEKRGICPGMRQWEFVKVIMKSSYVYKIDVTGDSLIALAFDVINKMKGKN